MKQKKKIILFSLFLLFLVLIIYALVKKDVVEDMYYNVLKQFYGEPFSEDGTINNSFFGIKSDGTKASETTKGINKAIEYASKNNIEYIKLEKGKYLIDGRSTSDLIGESTEKKGIIMQSNIIFDCNGSILEHIKCDVVNYAIFSVTDVQNVLITNGILFGDKDNHDYDNVKSTHEWGFGIDIRGSQNIQINNINISNFTGDGIIVNDFIKNDKYIRSKNLQISNCNIHDCRRQGISVIDVDSIDIYNNEIHDIKGTLPKTAIDLETNHDSNQKIINVKIYNNNFYELSSGTAILAFRQVYSVEIFNNQINGNILLQDIRDKISIFENTINGDIISNTTSTKELFRASINEIDIINNNINASCIEIGDTNLCKIFENNLNINELRTYSSNVIISENLINNGRIQCIYNVRENDQKLYKIVSTQDNIEELNMNGEYIKIYKTIEEVNKIEGDIFS